MTDSNDDNRRGRPPGRSDRSRTSGDRPRKPREGGDRPFRARGDDDRPRKPRAAGDKPFRSRDGDKPFRPRAEGGDRPFRNRDNDDRPRRSEGGDKPFRARSAGDKPFRPRPEGGDKPFRPRREDGDRPFRGRGSDERPRRFDRASEDRPRRAREESPEVRAEPQEPAEDRIAKVIARAGVASRRDAEVLIAEGRVTLNGKVLESPAVNVTATDTITVDGEPLPAKERTRLWLFHKPRGLVTTAKDPEGRPTVFDNLPEDLPRVVAVGRLDINTEGLLLLTNDGGLARVIAHPDTGWLRRYKVRAHGEINQADLDRLRDGISIDGIDYGPIEARLDRVQGDNAWITMGLREGKNREIKRILEHLGMQVNRLIRMSFGPFQLGDLEVGLVEEVRTKILKDQLGAALAAEAGVDFESPVREPIAPFGSSKKERDERPARSARGRDDERPRRRRDDDERPFRARDGERRGRDDEEPAKRPSRLDPKRSVWRAGETDEDAPRKKMPRRGADPREARAAAGERERERVGAITSKEGRKVRVERLVRQPQEEEAPAPRRGRAAAGGEDRPRRRDDRDAAPPRRDRAGGARPSRGDDERPRRSAGDRPFRARTEGGDDRPRARQGERPFRARGDDDRPRRGPPRGDGPSRGGPRGGAGGGFKGGPRGGASKGGASKGGFKGGSKGGPRGRR
ncbi:23S rRNA pseudouridine2605 synthase [Microvirga lupini]|uniref:Pseudouridine synthase n=1 Tax=Microvirga lupini TaxID=420324 RepID=A0A7W4VLW4_9HYPH|nr:pseudouridine synthase [Microvirga lupini]MBB3019037.1 23S rRNA pseudouridine2605 synthase [Microvirga lupini]